MAFGAPGFWPALAYLLIMAMGVVLAFVFESYWIKGLGFVIGLYGFTCLIVTNAWSYLLPPSRRDFEKKDGG